jgi:GNAT superfamily N-acetyltransferase
MPSSPTSFKIRPATKKDMQAIFDMIKGLAIYERAENQVVTDSDDLIRDGFGENPAFQAILGQNEDGFIGGFALFYPIYSTWDGRAIYLEDLFVKDECRGSGLGAALFEATQRAGVKMGAKIMRWQVLDWNEPAIEFYKKAKANLDDEWINGTIRLS